MSTLPSPADGPDPRRSHAGGRAGGLLARMRIRKKLVVLHTGFSLVLAGVLAAAVRPAIVEVVHRAESHEASLLLAVILAERSRPGSVGAADLVREHLGSHVEVVESAGAEELGLGPEDAVRVRSGGPTAVARDRGLPPLVVGYDPASGRYVGVAATLQGARDAVLRLYVLTTLALLGVYALVAAALELFVLPQHVYRPIRTLLGADRALQEGRQADEIIPPSQMPADELGEIMKSRNTSVLALRRHEADLAAALKRLEEVATDLKRKNHLLETARQNLADADRLASLGMMSAGIAHELNTPLAVIKGLVEKLNRAVDAPAGGNGARGPGLSAEEAALMLRVVGRLERLSESLLDFARARPHASSRVPLRPLVDEAWTLVSLDREARRVGMENRLPESLCALCDADRMVQVFVNLLRNAVDAMEGQGGGLITVEGHAVERDSPPRPWTTVTIADTGPGISPEMLSRLFQPFASTRLDSRGTGLGLAVAEGIVREHGGVIIAGNRAGGVSGATPAGGGAAGAVFEIMLPDADTAASRLRDDTEVPRAPAPPPGAMQ